jgi:hypothetical protein
MLRAVLPVSGTARKDLLVVMPLHGRNARPTAVPAKNRVGRQVAEENE